MRFLALYLLLIPIPVRAQNTQQQVNDLKETVWENSKEVAALNQQVLQHMKEIDELKPMVEIINTKMNYAIGGISLIGLIGTVIGVVKTIISMTQSRQQAKSSHP
jgi:biopolymer transport protein ExbB/TolQ